MNPEWEPPEDKKVASDASGEHHTWAWGGKEAMHPHWAVRRLTDDELRVKLPGAHFNMKQETREISIVCVGRGDHTITWMVQVPFLTNSVDLSAGVELVWQARAKPMKEQKKNTWKDDQKVRDQQAAQELKKRKKDDVTKSCDATAHEVV